MLEVTFKFKNDDQFHSFLEKAGIDSYTWTKGKITVDLSNEVEAAIKTVTQPAQEPTQPADAW